MGFRNLKSRLETSVTDLRRIVRFVEFHKHSIIALGQMEIYFCFCFVGFGRGRFMFGIYLCRDADS